MNDRGHSPRGIGRRALPFRALPVFFVSLALLVAVGCSGVPPETYCYQVSAGIVHTVDTGMTVAGDLYADGKLSDAQKVKLVAAHDVYRPAAQTIVAGCKAVDSQGDADKLVENLKKAADKLLETLVAAGVIR
ncbi:MAG: hypothetical protein KBB14_19735 [Thermoanaerobaculia bacterium]|nr:hypothetical protein [Thermoanaerobaculia bacterium]